jgi:hypothetical protein
MTDETPNITLHAQAVTSLMLDPTPEALTLAIHHLRAAARLHRTTDELARLEAAPTPTRLADERLLAQLLRTARHQHELATKHSADVLAGKRPKPRKQPAAEDPAERAAPRQVDVSNWPDPPGSPLGAAVMPPYLAR